MRAKFRDDDDDEDIQFAVRSAMRSAAVCADTSQQQALSHRSTAAFPSCWSASRSGFESHQDVARPPSEVSLPAERRRPRSERNQPPRVDSALGKKMLLECNAPALSECVCAAVGGRRS